jgi:hypothetical protein
VSDSIFLQWQQQQQDAPSSNHAFTMGSLLISRADWRASEQHTNSRQQSFI